MAQLRKDPRASGYLVDMDKWTGLMLVGEVELLQDEASRHSLSLAATGGSRLCLPANSRSHPCS